MRRGIRKTSNAVRSPAARPTGSDLARRDASLLVVLQRDCDRAARLAGDWLECAPGCADCCRGPFPITRLDAWRLERGLAALDRHEPRRAEQLRGRARRAVRALAPGFPGQPATGRLAGDEAALDRFLARHEGLDCPALDPRSRRCELYDFRPVSCRTYGPPARFGDVSTPPCSLCFRGAPRATVERCRVAPDPEGVEEALLRDLGVAAGADWETLIAFVLAGRATSGLGPEA